MTVLARRMTGIVLAFVAALAGGLLFAAEKAKDRVTVVVAVPARAGAVDGKTGNSDEFIWRTFVDFVSPAIQGQASPVVFDTWASDEDTFSYTPHWPSPTEPKKLHTSVLGAMSTPNHSPIDVPCSPPPGAATGGFPPTGCIAEEVKRNQPLYNYIVDNHLNTQAGLAAAYAKSFQVVMPTDAIAVKGDWVPVQTLVQWIPSLGDVANVRKQYYTIISAKVEYGLVALHVSSRQNTNWVWGTFEHQLNPGRCDSIGCFDTFGAKKDAVRPNQSTPNTQYGPCAKTTRLTALMKKANLSPVWDNYCLKSTEVDYTAPDGTPYALGSSVIERITGNGTVSASSCIACHVYASFGATGAPTAAATAMLPYNPTGNPLTAPLANSVQFDFMWGLLFAPPPPKPPASTVSSVTRH
jgi:hypothetical protein